MAKFGKTSSSRLKTCKPEIQEVMRVVIGKLPWTDDVSGLTIDDCGVICGGRGEEAQTKAFDDGTSKARWGESKHNTIDEATGDLVSDAVDTLPMVAGDYVWGEEYYELQGAYSRLVLGTANDLGYEWRWGDDWDRDGIRVRDDGDENLSDCPHFESLT